MGDHYVSGVVSEKWSHIAADRLRHLYDDFPPPPKAGGRNDVKKFAVNKANRIYSIVDL